MVSTEKNTCFGKPGIYLVIDDNFSGGYAAKVGGLVNHIQSLRIVSDGRLHIGLSWSWLVQYFNIFMLT